MTLTKEQFNLRRQLVNNYYTRVSLSNGKGEVRLPSSTASSPRDTTSSLASSPALQAPLRFDLNQLEEVPVTPPAKQNQNPQARSSTARRERNRTRVIAPIAPLLVTPDDISIWRDIQQLTNQLNSMNRIHIPQIELLKHIDDVIAIMDNNTRTDLGRGDN
ncbi:unnamed protein product [Caenorhabditis auriculariae]|uniref:Uncharacterized protein n=1 Tax=Caenorhabditis auriculariae TaxID=2777116 RepID=A0A8S1HR29_9PELO|nr:unnamed protein product [Caenorhabditis auriculariae]